MGIYDRDVILGNPEPVEEEEESPKKAAPKKATAKSEEADA